MKITTKLILSFIAAVILFFAGFMTDRFVCQQQIYIPEPTFTQMTPPPPTERLQEIEERQEAIQEQVQETMIEIEDIENIELLLEQHLRALRGEE